MSNSFVQPDIEDEVRERADDAKMRDMVKAMKEKGWTPEAEHRESKDRLLSMAEDSPAPRRTAPDAVRGQGITRPPQRKSKRRAKGKAQRRARKANRSKS